MAEMGDKLGVRLRNFSNALKEFRENVPDVNKAAHSWLQERQETIATLDRVIDKLDELHFRASVAQFTGSSFGLLGSIGTLVSTLMAPVNPAAQLLKAACSILTLLGNVTNLSASSVDGLLSTDLLQEAKTAIDRDQEHLQPIVAQFKRSALLNLALNKLFDLKTYDNSRVFTAFMEFGVLVESGSRALPEIVKIMKFSASYQNLPTFVQNRLLEVMYRIVTDNNLILTLREIAEFSILSPSFVSLASQSLEIFKEVYVIRTLGYAVGLTTVAASRYLPAADGAVFRCRLFEIALAATHVTNLIFARKDMKSGYKSKNSRNLLELREEMVREVGLLQSFLQNARQIT